MQLKEITVKNKEAFAAFGYFRIPLIGPKGKLEAAGFVVRAIFWFSPEDKEWIGKAIDAPAVASGTTKKKAMESLAEAIVVTTLSIISKGSGERISHRIDKKAVRIFEDLRRRDGLPLKPNPADVDFKPISPVTDIQIPTAPSRGRKGFFGIRKTDSNLREFVIQAFQ